MIMNVDISQSDHRTDQGETDLDRDESKSAFEEESRRFNGEYFNIFTQNNFANENHKEETSSEEDYKPDFEVIEEEIHNTEEREDCKSSDIYIQIKIRILRTKRGLRSFLFINSQQNWKKIRTCIMLIKRSRRKSKTKRRCG